MPVIISSFAGSHGTTRWSTGILEVIFSTIVNLAIENGRGAMGNFGSDDNCANCLPPPTRQKPSGLKVSLGELTQIFHRVLNIGWEL